MSRPQKPVTIPQAPAYGYRDARRGSVDGAEALAVAWAEGLGLPQVPESDVLALLNDKWCASCPGDQYDSCPTFCEEASSR